MNDLPVKIRLRAELRRLRYRKYPVIGADGLLAIERDHPDADVVHVADRLIDVADDETVEEAEARAMRQRGSFRVRPSDYEGRDDVLIRRVDGLPGVLVIFLKGRPPVPLRDHS